MTEIKQQRSVLKEVVVQVRCDNCGKLSPDGEPVGWRRNFSTSHSDWGNDSIDSWDVFDACSASCWLALIRKIVDDYEPLQREPTLSVDGMDYAFAKDLLAVTKASP